jgi:hypothetical protein
MRPLAGAGALILLLTACSEITPGTPQMMGANEMQERPGMFSGPDGKFTLVGDPDLPPDAQLEEEVGAGT